jgi:hypothetical protein
MSVARDYRGRGEGAAVKRHNIPGAPLRRGRARAVT